MLKVIIAGGRDFEDYDRLCERCHTLLKPFNEVEVVSGTARGADALGERYAKYRNYPIKRFKPNWSQGLAAGPIRNRAMADYADMLIAFWDGRSSGTRNMIDEASKRGLIVHVCTY